MWTKKKSDVGSYGCKGRPWGEGPRPTKISKTARMGRHIAWRAFNILVLKYCKTVFKHLELSSRNFKKEISLH